MARKPLKFQVNPLLSGPTLEARTKSGSPYREIALGDIDVDPDQPRRSFDDQSLAELAASIKQYGVLCPILVRPTEGGSFRVVAGERRFRASKLLGRESIPAIVDNSEGTKGETLAKQLVENLQREDIPPLERADAIAKLREELKLSVREIAVQLGVSKSYVQRSLEILSLPDDLKAALQRGASESKIFILAQVTDLKVRATLLGKLEEMTRAELELEISKLDGSSAEEKVSHGGTVSKVELSPADRRVVEDLQKTLGLRIDISRKKEKPEQGRVSLEFYGDEDLREIYRRLIRD